MRVRTLPIVACILIVSLAHAQGINDVVVQPLAGAASCYAGTAGTDHVIFLKSKSSQADCDVVGGGSPCLARREFAGDGPNGRPVSLLAAIVQKPTVTGAGDFVAFTEFGFNACLMQTASEDTEGCLGRDFFGFDPHSVSINAAGTALLMTQLDAFTFEPTRFIRLLNPNTFALLEPIYQVSVAGPGGTALEVEHVELTVDGDYLIFDARNPVTGLWGIYATSRATAVTTMLVPPVAGLVIRNPALAQTSDDHMVFDAQVIATGANVVFAANIRTGVLSQVAATLVQGAPSYTGNDGAVVFNEVDATVTSQTSLDIQPLGANRLTPVGARTRWLSDGFVPAVYRRGAWNGTLLDPAICAAESNVACDLDGDGMADVLWRNTATGRVDYWQMNAPGITTSSIIAGVGDFNWQIIGVGDYNGDGKADILWRNVVTGRVDMWEMNGPSITLSSIVAGVADLNWQIIGNADYTGDGKTDILWRNMVTGRVDMWEMNGPMITLSSLVAGVADLNWQVKGSGDITGDGKADVLWRNVVTGRVDIWEMNGPMITLSSLVAGVGDPNWQIMGVGDFTGDGKDDVFWRNVVTGRVDLWEMNGPLITLSSLVAGVADLNWQIIGIYDYNGDGKHDVLWRNMVTGRVDYWEMNGPTITAPSLVAGVADLNWQVVDVD